MDARALLVATILLTTWTNRLPASADQPVVFSTIAIGSRSSIRKHAPRQYSIYEYQFAPSSSRLLQLLLTPSEWRSLWQKHTAEDRQPPARPAVDFSHEMVIPVFAGEVPARMSMMIQAIAAQKNRLVVYMRMRNPQPERAEVDFLAERETPFSLCPAPSFSTACGLRYCQDPCYLLVRSSTFSQRRREKYPRQGVAGSDGACRC